MQREEFLQLLKDPIVCQEIYKIVQNGGQPLPVIAASKETPVSLDAAGVSPAPTATNALAPKATNHKGVDINSPNTERIAVLREKWRKELMQKKAAAETESVKEEPTVDTTSEAESTASEYESEEKVTATEGSKQDQQDLAQKLAVLRRSVEKKQEYEQVEAELKANKETHDDEYTFVIERKCPICEQTTRIVKCRTRMIAETKDLDFCVHYKDFNPYLYSVVACEHCGFAAEERRFLGHMPNRTREQLRKYLEENDLRMDFAAERTTEEALQYCQMAILFTELVNLSLNRRAGLYLTMAWIYRYNGDKENDLACVQKAADLYDESLRTERYPVGGMTDNTATYLAGVLYYMLKNYEKCTMYLSRIIGSQSFRAEDPKTYAKARDLWQEIKTKRQALREKENAAKLGE